MVVPGINDSSIRSFTIEMIFAFRNFAYVSSGSTVYLFKSDNNYGDNEFISLLIYNKV